MGEFLLSLLSCFRKIKQKEQMEAFKPSFFIVLIVVDAIVCLWFSIAEDKSIHGLFNARKLSLRQLGFVISI